MRTELQREQEEARLADWRHDQLVRSGFPPILARQLADDPRYDLHALIELVERSCPPELAVRILAPIDDGNMPDALPSNLRS